jgi:hypothetical protein
MLRRGDPAAFGRKRSLDRGCQLPTGRPCPQCFQTVPLEIVWSLAPRNRFGFLRYSTGVVCPSCGAKLRIVQRQSVVFLAVLWIIALIAAEAAGRLDIPFGNLPAFAVLAAFFTLSVSGPLQRRVAELKLRDGIDTVDFPVERLKQELSGKAQQDREAELAARTEAIDSWVCIHCGEPSPIDCPACVNCGRSQPGMSK